MVGFYPSKVFLKKLCAQVYTRRKPTKCTALYWIMQEMRILSLWRGQDKKLKKKQRVKTCYSCGSDQKGVLRLLQKFPLIHETWVERPSEDAHTVHSTKPYIHYVFFFICIRTYDNFLPFHWKVTI
jgi:hypothetical protein